MARSFVFHAPIRKKNCGKLRLLEISGSIGNAFDSKFPRDSLGGEISRLPWLKVETELTSPPWSSTSARTRSTSRDFRQRFSPPRFWHLNVSLSPSLPRYSSMLLNILLRRWSDHCDYRGEGSREFVWYLSFFFLEIRKEIGRLRESKIKIEIED